MRLVLLPAILLLTACASQPSADDYVDEPLQQRVAAERELTNMEARLRQLRTQIDLDDDADADTLAAYNAARDDYLELRSLYPGVDSGFNDLGWDPLEALGKGVYQTGGSLPTEPGGIVPEG